MRISSLKAIAAFCLVTALVMSPSKCGQKSLEEIKKIPFLEDCLQKMKTTYIRLSQKVGGAAFIESLIKFENSYSKEESIVTGENAKNFNEFVQNLSPKYEKLNVEEIKVDEKYPLQQEFKQVLLDLRFAEFKQEHAKLLKDLHNTCHHDGFQAPYFTNHIGSDSFAQLSGHSITFKNIHHLMREKIKKILFQKCVSQEPHYAEGQQALQSLLAKQMMARRKAIRADVDDDEEDDDDYFGEDKGEDAPEKEVVAPFAWKDVESHPNATETQIIAAQFCSQMQDEIPFVKKNKEAQEGAVEKLREAYKKKHSGEKIRHKVRNTFLAPPTTPPPHIANKNTEVQVIFKF